MDQSTGNFQGNGAHPFSYLPKVAVVILNWNGRKYLEQFLPALLASTYPNKKIIVADNASTDDSVAFIKEHFPTVELLFNSSNEGFAKGYNSALKRVESDYYVLLNSDVEVTKHWIEPVITLMESDVTIAACQPKIRSYAMGHMFEYAGACGGWIDSLGYPFARGRVFDLVENDVGQYDDVQPCFWASGAALFVKAKIYQQLGGLDEYFFAHQEEIDFCWRLQLAGYKIYVQPQSVVYHIGGGTLPKENTQKVFLNFRNNLVMLAKNLSFKQSLWKIPARICLDIIAALKGLVGGSGGYFVAIFKAHIYFLKWLIIDRRQSLKPATKKRTLYGVYKGSVIWQHFVKKKNRFYQIVYGK